MAKVTVGIPIYNEEKHIGSSLESAINQDYRDLEVLLSDNASTDKTYRIARDYADRDKRIKLIRQTENIGALANFELCLTKADSKYFVWLGGHDTFNADYLKTAIEYLEENPHVMMVYPGDAVFVDEDDQILQSNACANIESKGVTSAIHRAVKVIRKPDFCTNIHGVFRTKVAKELPFYEVIGSDNLQLLVTALCGEIHALDIQGIRRREHRVEDYEEKKKRWLDQENYKDHWYDPKIIMVWKQLCLVVTHRNVGYGEKLLFIAMSPFVIRWIGPVRRTALKISQALLGNLRAL